MDRRDIFRGIYKDFFGMEDISEKNARLAEDIERLNNISIDNDNIPEISVDKSENRANEVQLETSQAEKDRYKAEFRLKIDELYIDDKSKELLNKIIEYMERYDKKIEKLYIPFDMSIYTNNAETVEKIIDIVLTAGVLFSYIREGRAATYSMYDIDDIAQIEEMYDVKNNMVIIKNLETFNTKEQAFKNKFINKLYELLEKNQAKVLTVLNADTKKLVDKDLRKTFDFEIFGIEPDIQDVYNEVLEKVKANVEITDEFEVKLLDYISSTYPNNTLPYPEYRDNLCEKLLFNKEVPEYDKDKTMEEIFAELNSLVGLQKVKEMLKDLANLIELKNKTKDDLKIKNVNLHMIFLGNPGTGKTTVARIVAEILYNLKYIKQNKLIEVSSKDLVAEYVGQTAPKTMAVIQKAMRRSIIHR